MVTIPQIHDLALDGLLEWRCRSCPVAAVGAAGTSLPVRGALLHARQSSSCVVLQVLALFWFHPPAASPCTQAAKLAYEIYHAFFSSTDTVREVVQRLKLMSQKLHELTAATPNSLVTPTVMENSLAPSFNFGPPERQLSVGEAKAMTS